MPTLLAIETSSETASAALLHSDRITSRQTDGVMNHSQAILPMVQSLLAEAGIDLADCEAIAFGSGPGSFTGVRTACGVVQGLAFGADRPVIPVVTLLALAEAQRASGAVEVLSALDARMGEVYWAQYRYDAGLAAWQTVLPPALGAPSQVQPEPDSVNLVLAGNGFAAYAGQFTLPESMTAAAQNTVPTAVAILGIAQTEFAAGRLLPASEAQPLYLRNKIALTSAERAALAKQ